MKYSVFSLLACIFLFVNSNLFSQTWVDGYLKKDGTYVPGHFRSNSNSTTWDNYSTKGNVNPFTGENGYKNPYSTSKESDLFNFNSQDYDWSKTQKKSNNDWNNSIWHSDVKVKDYLKTNGTEVESYYRTSPNNSTWDNYSTQGNYNPYTGKKGTKKIK